MTGAGCYGASGAFALVRGVELFELLVCAVARSLDLFFLCVALSWRTRLGVDTLRCPSVMLSS